MNRCIIFAGGKPEPYLPDGVDVSDAFIIAADRGYKNCKKLGFTPDLTIGDFDSLGYIPKDCEHMQFPKEKDDSDLMLAAREAIARGCADITILGATGGRFDHMYANVQTLAFIRKEGAWGRIVSIHEEIMMLTAGTYQFAAKKGFSLSLFAYSEVVDGLEISGVKYPAEDMRLFNKFPIGLSNEITSEKATVSFESGMLLAVRSRL